MPTPPPYGRSRSWSAWSRASSPSFEDVSLQDLEPSESTGSFAGLLPEKHENDNRGEQSNVYKGVKNLFFGRAGSTSDHRRRSEEPNTTRGSTSPMSRPRLNRSATEVAGRRNSSTNNGDDVENPLETSLVEGQNLNVIRQGLNEALGSDGKGTWLAAETGSLFSRQESTSDISPTGSRTDLSPAHAFNSEYRKSQHSDQSKVDSASLAEEGRLTPSSTNLAPSRDLSPARKFSSLVRNFSSRVVSGSDRSASPRSSLHQPRNSGCFDPGPAQERQQQESTDNVNQLEVHGDEDYIDPQHSVFAVEQGHPEPSVTEGSETGSQPEAAHFIEPQLGGKSLCIFDKNSKMRRNLYQLLHELWVEPLILVLILLQTVVLSFLMAPSVHEVRERSGVNYMSWGSHWSDWVLLVLFIVYTIESLAKIIAYGLWDDSQLVSESSTIIGDWKNNSFFNLFKRNKNKLTTKKQAPVVLRTLTTFVSSGKLEQYQIPVERAYLRSSWNRVDFISVVSYWVYMLLSIHDIQNNHKFYVFRLLAHLRILRLLNLTHGTSAVLRSIKKAAPLLSNIALFIGFFW